MQLRNISRALSLAGRAALAATLLGCNDEVTGLGPPSDPATETFAASLNVNIASMTKLPTGVYLQDLTTGTGAEVTAASDSVWVTYAGFLKDAKLFDSGTNVRFVRAGLIAGFRDGVVGMKVGGKRKLVIPSEQGYGGVSQKDANGQITIPRQSTLVFDVELLKVHTPESTTPPPAIRGQ